MSSSKLKAKMLLHLHTRGSYLPAKINQEIVLSNCVKRYLPACGVKVPSFDKSRL